MPGVYDDQKTEAPLVPSDAELSQLTGIGSHEESKMDHGAARGAKKDSKKNKDSGPVSPGALKASEGAGAAGLAGGVAGGAAGIAKKLGNIFAGNRKRKAASGGAGAGIIMLLLGFGTFSAVQGPLQFVHAAELLTGFHFSAQSDFSDRRSAKFILYALSGKAAKGRLGVVDNKIADKMEKRLGEKSGLRSVYSSGTQRLIGYEITDANKAARFTDDLNKDGFPSNSQLEGVDINGKPVKTTGVRFDENSFRTRRSITRTAVRSTGVNRITAALSKRLLVKRGGVNFHPLKNVVRQKADDFVKWREAQREARAKAIDDGVAGSADPIKEDLKVKEGKVRTALKTAKGPLIAVIAFCAVKNFSSSIDAQNLANQQILIRLGMDAITTGDQVKYGGDFNSEQLGALNADFYDPTTGTSWVDDPGVQQELGESPTGPDLAAPAKPGKEKPAIFQLVDIVPDLGACGLISDIGEVISNTPVVKQALELLNSAISGAFHLVGLSSPEEYLDQARKYFASGAIDLLSRGALRGGYMNIGTRLAANNDFQASGARELTDAEATQVKTTSMLNQKQELAEANFYDKYLSLHTGTSLLSSAILRTPHSFSQLATSISQFPAMLSNLAVSVVGGRTAEAAVPPYVYGFPLYGFSAQEQDNPEFDNMFDNEAYMLDGNRLERMNADYGDPCFGMQIGRDGTLNYGPSKDFHSIPDNCKDTSNDELTHYRFYLADVINADGLACYYDDADSCSQLNGSAGAVATPAPAAPAPGGGVTGDGPTLAKQVLALKDAGKVKIDPSALADITAASNGQTVMPGPIAGGGAGTKPCAAQVPTLIDPQLLQVMINIAAKYVYTIHDITSGHNCDTGRHPLGRAMDIFEVTGTPITWDGANAQTDRDFATYIISVLSTLLPNGSQATGNMGGIGVGDSSCLANPIPHPDNINYFVDACDEVHVDVGFPPK